MSSPREWMDSFSKLKQRVQSRRSSPQSITAEEVNGFSQALQRLEKQLNSENTLAASEIARRRALVENVKKQLNGVSSSSSPSSTAGANTNSSSSSSSSASGGGSSIAIRPPQQQTQMQRTREVMAQQDLMLDDLEKGVGRLFQQSRLIGDEAKSQIGLLDNMENDVENATMSLRQEARHAEKVREQSQTWWLYLCIALEVGALAMLLVLGFS